ncbi:MAG: 16S rRNA (guanine(527)-N(7))-methyltransferase RsmG [Lentimicrobiaceae bacterium]|nr:16S rRNA (guanine(527)-N(7))-methyltransferase RsmG [Lentimicrobiaceae bacterium]
MTIIEKYFPALTEKQHVQFAALQELYVHWNSQINVISRKDIDNLYLNHVLHSLSIAKLLSFKNQTTVLDVGTGGGFPGIPLAILFPKVLFHLVDSVGKKIKVAQNVADALGLKNVECTQIRAEELKDEYDFVVSRAVTALPEFYRWVGNRISKTAFNTISNGILYLKGGDVSEELKEIPRKSTLYPISDWFEEEYFSEKYIIHIPFGKKPVASEY